MRFDDAERRLGAGSGQDLLVVSPRRVGDRAVIELAGELDLDGKQLLAAVAQAALEDPPRPKGIDIDARGIEFIDSSGLATLLQIREQASLESISFNVTGASAEFRRVVGLAGLDNVLSLSSRPAD